MVNAIFDDETDSTRYRWVYPDTKSWDAERNTQEFLANMPIYRKKGLLAFTVNLQGGSPQGYSKSSHGVIRLLIRKVNKISLYGTIKRGS